MIAKDFQHSQLADDIVWAATGSNDMVSVTAWAWGKKIWALSVPQNTALDVL